MSMTLQGAEGISKSLYRYDRVYQPLPDLAAFDDAALDHYRTQGFVAIEDVLSPVDVASAMEGINALIARGDPEIISFESSIDVSALSPAQREAAVRKCMGFVQHEARLAAMAHHRRLLDVVEKLMGSEIVLLQDMALLKPPMIGREKPWHQDSAYFSYGPPELVIGTWTALDPATVSNGCMHVIPGSHLHGAMPHYHDRDCQLPDEAIDVEHDVAVPLSPGGVLFFHALLHHGTPPNRSPDRRRALQFHYRSSNAKPMTLEEHQAIFHDDRGWAGCNSWHYGTSPRSMRTEA